MPEPPSDFAPSRTLEMAHVLFMDIVAYSQLPMDEQTHLIEKLQQIVRNTGEFSRAQKRRQLLRLPTGDGMALVFFGDAEAPVRCALEISRVLRELPNLKLRMGIHTGPVQRVEDINANRNVAGGGINIAQRVMDCGDAGHILISKSVADVLDQVSTWKTALHDLGEAEVKHGVRVHLYNLYTDEAGNRELPQKLRSVQTAAATARFRSKRKKLSLGLVAVGLIGALAISGFLYSRRAHVLTDKDTIVLTDFANSTGDAVFDGTLRQGLSSQLEQSPFLNLVSDERIADTLALMTQPKDARLTRELAREVCERIASAASIEGSISSLGSLYVVGLKAVNCRNGDVLADEQVTASGKEQVLKALGEAATKIRERLGESLASVQKFDVPPENVTTPSLEALQAYSLGYQAAEVKNDATTAVSFFQRAISLDSNFAMAYARLGTNYFNTGQMVRAAENIRRAYKLRERVSEREKLYIVSHYEHFVTGNLEAARKVYELWAQTYPRDSIPLGNLGLIYVNLGDHEKSLAAAQKSMKLDPGSGICYANLIGAYVQVNRLDEARAAAQEAQAHNLDNPSIHVGLHAIDFLQHDAAGMEREAAALMGKPGLEDRMMDNESDTAAYSGQFAKARELTRRASDSAQRADEKEMAAGYEAEAAVREALVGNMSRAKQQAQAALALTTGKDVDAVSAIALGLAGDFVQATRLADNLAKRFPEDTIVQFNYLPTIHAAAALQGGSATKAIEALAPAVPFELGDTSEILNFALYPVYLRCEAYVAAHQGGAAVAEFQKILEHPGVVEFETIGALAHLGFARSYVIQGDTAKAKSAYLDFFTLWKDADPDIPILKEAKAEYAKLQ